MRRVMSERGSKSSLRIKRFRGVLCIFGCLNARKTREKHGERVEGRGRKERREIFFLFPPPSSGYQWRLYSADVRSHPTEEESLL